VALRSDWVHNSNDSFFYTHPQQRFEGIGPLVGDDVLRRPRTRSGLIEVPELLARGPVTPQAALAQLFNNRNLMARAVLPDLLAACVDSAPTPEAQDGCAVLKGWDRSNNLDARGAVVFREFWRTASNIAGVYRVPFDKAQPTATPLGLKMNDAAVAAKVWDALTQAVSKVRGAGVALDAPLGSVQRPGITDDKVGLHGGEDFEGVLNNIGNPQAGITNQGLRITAGLSYLQAVTFDDRGPVAQGLLSYGQSTNPASAFAYDQLPLLSRKVVPVLPFYAEDVARERVGEVLRLTRP
jgi:acyl-homoserine-lactone acylase